MAVRYSGEVEVRFVHARRELRVTVRWPGGRASETIAVERSAIDPDVYDRFAARVIDVVGGKRRKPLPAERDRQGRTIVRRTFQAPCPV